MSKNFTLWKLVFLHDWSRASRNIYLQAGKKAVSEICYYMPRRPYVDLSLYIHIYVKLCANNLPYEYTSFYMSEVEHPGTFFTGR
jgi:hypothetical protein